MYILVYTTIAYFDSYQTELEKIECHLQAKLYVHLQFQMF